MPEGILQQAQQAADQGKLWQFIQLWAGLQPNAKTIPSDLWKSTRRSAENMAAPSAKICGVETENIHLPTRLHQWRITKNLVETNSTNRRSAKLPSGSNAAFAAQPPWSSVN